MTQNKTINDLDSNNSPSESVSAVVSLFSITSLYIFLLLEICKVGSIEIREHFLSAGLCISLGAVVAGIFALIQRCFVKRQKWWLAIISIPLASIFFLLMCLIDAKYEVL